MCINAHCSVLLTGSRPRRWWLPNRHVEAEPPGRQLRCGAVPCRLGNGNGEAAGQTVALPGGYRHALAEHAPAEGWTDGRHGPASGASPLPAAKSRAAASTVSKNCARTPGNRVSSIRAWMVEDCTATVFPSSGPSDDRSGSIDDLDVPDDEFFV